MMLDNAEVIAEFRRSGKVGGELEGAPLLLLTTYQRADARPRTVPLVYSKSAEGHWLVFAANAGKDQDPAWCMDLRHEPAGKIEIPEAGAVSDIWVDAAFLDGAVRQHYYDQHAKLFPRYADFAAATSREIPVISLAPVHRLVQPRGTR